jgi:hypothetical protein
MRHRVAEAQRHLCPLGYRGEKARFQGDEVSRFRGKEEQRRKVQRSKQRVQGVCQSSAVLYADNGPSEKQ